MKLIFVWSANARAELRRVERETARRILLALTRYAETGEGDVNLREGFAVRITSESATGACDRRAPGDAIDVLAAENRGQAY